ncbi:hypothetical protein [Gracilibacillus salinarum]|nr:hypothetical protein [Gracilibacillus salinarum]
MKHNHMDIPEWILFILGMTLCGVLLFVLTAGVGVALLAFWEGEN